MSVVILFFYIVVIMIVVANVLRIAKSFKANDRMFDNIESMVRQRYNSLMQNNASDENKIVNDIDNTVNLDDFMKSNSNPIKEVKGKRRKI